MLFAVDDYTLLIGKSRKKDSDGCPLCANSLAPYIPPVNMVGLMGRSVIFHAKKDWYFALAIRIAQQFWAEHFRRMDSNKYTCRLASYLTIGIQRQDSKVIHFYKNRI